MGKFYAENFFRGPPEIKCFTDPERYADPTLGTTGLDRLVSF